MLPLVVHAAVMFVRRNTEAVTTASVEAADSGSRKSGRPPLPQHQILAAATALIDAEGADALTLRSLATRLGSSTATLYRHFENRSRLIDGVVDAVFGEVELGVTAARPTGWDAAVIAMATSLFDALERHRNIAPLMLERTRTASNAIRIREHVLRMLLEQGFGPKEAVLAYSTIGRFVLGFGVQARADDRAFGSMSDEYPLTAAEHPATTEVASSVTVTLAEEFQFGLKAIVLGIRSSSSDRIA